MIPHGAAGAGAAVGGWSPDQQAWITDAATAGDVRPVPDLDGALELPLATEAFEENFGRLLHQEPRSIRRVDVDTGEACAVANGFFTPTSVQAPEAFGDFDPDRHLIVVSMDAEPRRTAT